MATAIIGGLLQQGFAATEIEVVEVSAEQRGRLATAHKVSVVADIGQVTQAPHTIVLSVKPQQMREVAAAVAPQLRDQLLITIAAGIRTQDLSRWCGGYDRIVRAMPNTPALLRAGVTGLFASPRISADDRQMAERLLHAVGKVLWFDREDALDAVTAVSGSGPAYVFFFIEALQQAGVQVGLSESESRELALETFLGAAKLAVGSSDDVATLRQRVTSKGGTTERGLATLEEAQVRAAIVEAVRAAADRSRQLGLEFGKSG